MVGKERTLAVCLAAVVIGSCHRGAGAQHRARHALGRILQGLGGAAFPLSFGIIRDEFPAERVPSAVGWMSSVIAVGGGIGMIVAGPIVELARLALAVLAAGRRRPRDAPAAATLPARIEESARGGRINWLAALLLAGWLLALLLPLSQGDALGLVVAARSSACSSPPSCCWPAGRGRADRSAMPLIDMRMMRMPAVWRANLVALLFGATMFAVWAFLPQLVQVPVSAGYGFGATVTQAGWVMLPMLVTMAIAGSFSGPLAPVIGFKWQAAFSAGLIALACAGLAFYHADAARDRHRARRVFGVGLGLVYAALTSLIVQSVPAAQTGTAIGMNTNIRTIGGAVGTAIMTAIVTAQHRPDGIPLEQGFTGGFVLFGGVAVLALLVALMIPSAPRRRLMPATA